MNLKKAFTNSFLVAVTFLFVGNSKAQYEVAIPKWMKKTPIKAIYVVDKNLDTTTSYTKKVIELFRTYWKQSPVFFAKEVPDMSENGIVIFDVYVFGGTITTATDRRVGETFEEATQRGHNKEVQLGDYGFFFNLWTMDGKKSLISKREIYDVIKTDIFSRYGTYVSTIKNDGPIIEISIGKKSIADSNLLRKFSIMDSTISNYFLNTTLGHLKNYIQNFNSIIDAKKDEDPYGDIVDKNEIRNLANQILYIPNYWEGDEGTIIPTNSKDNKKYSKEIKDEINELVSEYGYKYKVVSRKELSDLILNSKNPIYYLSWIQRAGLKCINVYNSLTGKRVYAEVKNMSYRLKGKDLVKLTKAI